MTPGKKHEEKKRQRHQRDIPESKKKAVKTLAEKMTSSRTVLLASCKGLPGQQFHEIKKNLRGKADMSVAKKSIIMRAIESIDKGVIQNLKKELRADMVLFFSEMDPYSLASVLKDNQTPAKARPGDLAPEDLKIEAGPTELLPGPAISELGSIGLKVKVTNGKLEITRGVVVAKKGEEIKANVASVLAKLDVKPMKVGFIPIAAYDAEDDVIYLDINIDKEGALKALHEAVSKALGFAINIDYPAKETISYFIAKASAEEKALEKVLEVKSTSTESGRKEDLSSSQREAPQQGEDARSKNESEKEKKEDLNTQTKNDKEEA